MCSRPFAFVVSVDPERLGAWLCNGCHEQGGLDALRRAFGDAPLDRAGSPPATAAIDALTRGIQARLSAPKRPDAPAAKPEPEKRADSWRGASGSPLAFRRGLDDDCHAELFAPSGAEVLAYLTGGRRLSEGAIREFRLGAIVVPLHRGGRPWPHVVIPLYGPDGDLVNARFRPIPGTCPDCGGGGCPKSSGRRPTCRGGKVEKAYLRCPGRPSTLYGADRLPNDLSSRIVIAEGELDVVAAWDLGLTSGVVSGTEGAGSWDDAWLDMLEPYDQFALAYDGDEAGDKGAQALAARLGRYRCTRVRLPHNDIGECLQRGMSSDVFASVVDSARPMLSVEVRRVGAFRTEIEAKIADPEMLRGIPTPSDQLTRCMGGLRPGLVVVTGDTSAGKTSFATWLSHGVAKQHGIPCLLTCFEQRADLVQKLLRIECGGDFVAAGERRRTEAFGVLDRMPIHIVDHYGQLSPAKQIETIRYYARREGVRLAVVDHLGFLVDDGAEDERKMIEATIRALFTVGKEDGVCIVLIAHPNRVNVQQKRRVTIRDIKGASAAEQDSDVGLVIEALAPTSPARPKEHRAGKGRDQVPAMSAVYVDKMRSEWGLRGSRATLFYDIESCVYADRMSSLPSERGW